MAWNVGTGIERHYHLYQAFEKALEGKLVGEGKEEIEKWFAKTDKYFEEVIILFKGPPGSKRPEEGSGALSSWPGLGGDCAAGGGGPAE